MMRLMILVKMILIFFLKTKKLTLLPENISTIED